MAIEIEKLDIIHTIWDCLLLVVKERAVLGKWMCAYDGALWEASIMESEGGVCVFLYGEYEMMQPHIPFSSTITPRPFPINAITTV